MTPARCTDDGYRYLGINVTHKVTNDGDSGFTRYWASLDYNRHIQVWEVGVVGGDDDERFCALVRYQGAWISTAGASPMGTDPSLAAGVDGTFEPNARQPWLLRLRLDWQPRHRRNNTVRLDQHLLRAGRDVHAGVVGLDLPRRPERHVGECVRPL